jgi:hypothetical protein
MAKTKTPQRPLADHTQPVVQTLMGKVAPAKPATTKQPATTLGAHRGK